MAAVGTCASCSAENPAGARFCMSCGEGMPLPCANCGTTPPAGARFCIDCGATLAEAGAASPPQPEPAEAPPEERRQVTVLFADLSGYTAAAERMDPEAVKALVDRTLRRLAHEVERLEGSIDKFIGDNVMGVFGAPVAHEDDPERAVRAGLAMQDAMGEMNAEAERDEGVSFALRVGINTGEVMAGAVGDRYTVMGDPVNVAARLQAAGRPGAVTVGVSTQRATRDAVAYNELEPLRLKGKEELVPAWEAVRMLSGPRRGPRRHGTPLIGRSDEAELLASLVDRVRGDDRPHLVTVIGQAGVGKSRLLSELLSAMREPRLLPERAQGETFTPTVRLGQCPPYGAGISYWALGEVLREEFSIAENDPAQAAWEKLRDGVSELLTTTHDAEAAARTAALIALPLGIEIPADTKLAEGQDPERMREALFAAVRAVIEAISKRNPLVLAIDDIHWADEGMLDLIDHLALSVRGPLLLVCLTRDELFERRPGWGGGRRNATAIALEPLSSAETRELVAALMPSGAADADAVTARLAERAGGNPLFAEEMVNRLRDEGVVELDSLPSTVQSLLASRLDSLGRRERRLLLHAAVMGQTFSAASLEPVAQEEGIDLESALGSLEDKDLITPRTGVPGESNQYAFKHVLIRDVAYGMLPKAVRCKKHIEVADLIERRAGDRPESVVGLIAEHYERAVTMGAETGMDPGELGALRVRAVERLEAAGDAAAALYSNGEALDRYTTALELGDEIGDSIAARIGEKQGDVALRTGRVDQAIGVWERCLEFYGDEKDVARVADLHRKIGAGHWHRGERKDSIDNYQRGIDLLKDGDPSIELVRLYEEAASLYMHTGDNMLAIYASEKALRLAERLGEASAASRAKGIFGRVFGRIGNAQKARENLEDSVTLARESDRAEAVRALLTLGYHLEASEADYPAAAEAYREALETAQQVGDLTSQVELHASLGQLAIHRTDWEEVEREAEASASLAEREGLHGKLCFPFVLRGVLAWRRGEWLEAERACRRAHELGEEVGRSEVAFQGLFWLAATLRDRGELAGAEVELMRTMEICERAGLIAQRVEAVAARTVALALSGRADEAGTAAEEAAELAERLHYPVVDAASAEARAAHIALADGDAGAAEEARGLWGDLGRPLDAARVLLVRGQLLGARSDDAAAETLTRAADELEGLGVSGLAGRARELATRGP